MCVTYFQYTITISSMMRQRRVRADTTTRGTIHTILPIPGWGVRVILDKMVLSETAQCLVLFICLFLWGGFIYCNNASVYFLLLPLEVAKWLIFLGKKKSNFFCFEKILKLKRRQINNQNAPTFVNVLLDLLTSFQKPNRATMVSIYTNTQAHEQ